jgi:hypothetical protein
MEPSVRAVIERVEQFTPTAEAGGEPDDAAATDDVAADAVSGRAE